MYGFPLTIYLLLPWLSRTFPGIDFLTHDAGHLLQVMFGGGLHPHLGPFHIASNVLIFGGFLLLSSAWQVLYRAQRSHGLATTGPYAHVRHPQYLAFIPIMSGFLLQWPTLTLVLFPVLVVVYAGLAKAEERDCAREFGPAYEDYRRRVPAFVPRAGRQDVQSGYR